MTQEITSPNGVKYSIKERPGRDDNRIKATSCFNFYICTTPEHPEQELVLKIATEVEYNNLLGQEVSRLHFLRGQAVDLEKEYLHISKEKEPVLNYQLGFPKVVDSFVSETQGGRRVAILGFDIANELGNLVPVLHVTTRDRVRVDPKTSAWILGKFLKLLVFFQSQNISVGQVSGGNMLIERDQHYLAFFDLSDAVFYPEGVPKEIFRNEISKIAQAVIVLLGGSGASGKIPCDDQLTDGRYEKILGRLAFGDYDDAAKAHEEFYQVMRALWGKKFHPYTTYLLN
jgi:hypothetical protein